MKHLIRSMLFVVLFAPDSLTEAREPVNLDPQTAEVNALTPPVKATSNENGEHDRAGQTDYPRALPITVSPDRSRLALVTREGQLQVLDLKRNQVKFKADTSKLWKQLEKTADKYGWTIPRSKTYGTGAGGVEMIKPPGEASVFYHAIDTSGGNSVSPHRQARISSLLLDRIFGQTLSGMSVTDLPSDHTSESYERVIK